MRTYDALGRYGGEEFLVVLPGCGEENTFGHAERLRMAICGSPISLGWTQVTVTGSFGACSMTPDCPWTADQLIHVADEALYMAKRSGRNRVHYIPALEPQLRRDPRHG
jgi:diguanylate cyclase (GGDEF)-like protein